MQKITIMPFNRYPKKNRNAWIPSNHLVGCPHLTTCGSFLKLLHQCDSKAMLKCKRPHGKLDQWIPHVYKYKTWLEITENYAKFGD